MIVFTKFHKDRTKIVYFWLIVKMLACSLFYVHPLMWKSMVKSENQKCMNSMPIKKEFLHIYCQTTTMNEARHPKSNSNQMQMIFSTNWASAAADTKGKKKKSADSIDCTTMHDKLGPHVWLRDSPRLPHTYVSVSLAAGSTGNHANNFFFALLIFHLMHISRAFAAATF